MSPKEGKTEKPKERSKKPSKGETTTQPPNSLPDPVDEASRESFPASDPPAWNSGASEAERESGE